MLTGSEFWFGHHAPERRGRYLGNCLCLGRNCLCLGRSLDHNDITDINLGNRRRVLIWGLVLGLVLVLVLRQSIRVVTNDLCGCNCCERQPC